MICNICNKNIDYYYSYTNEVKIEFEIFKRGKFLFYNYESGFDVHNDKTIFRKEVSLSNHFKCIEKKYKEIINFQDYLFNNINNFKNCNCDCKKKQYGILLRICYYPWRNRVFYIYLCNKCKKNLENIENKIKEITNDRYKQIFYSFIKNKKFNINFERIQDNNNLMSLEAQKMRKFNIAIKEAMKNI